MENNIPLDKETIQAYNDGFKSGIEWPDSWESYGKPGGPVVLNKRDAEINKAWRKGWKDGHDQKMRTKK